MSFSPYFVICISEQSLLPLPLVVLISNLQTPKRHNLSTSHNTGNIVPRTPLIINQTLFSVLAFDGLIAEKEAVEEESEEEFDSDTAAPIPEEDL